MPLKHSIWNMAPSGAALSKGNSTSPHALSLRCGQGLLGSITAQMLWARWGPLPSQGGVTGQGLETWECKGMERKKSPLPPLLPKTPQRHMSSLTTLKLWPGQRTQPHTRHTQTN